MKITLLLLRSLALVFAALVLLPTIGQLSRSLFSLSFLALINAVLGGLPLLGFILFFFLSRGAQRALSQRRRMSSKEAKEFILAIVGGTVASVLAAVVLWMFSGIDSGEKSTGFLVAPLMMVAAVVAWLAYAYVAIQHLPEKAAQVPPAPKASR